MNVSHVTKQIKASRRKVQMHKRCLPKGAFLLFLEVSKTREEPFFDDKKAKINF